ncbi:hypothetical protein DPEC_G00319860 [Dallia pectoralis]|uniref:Uncharacterized protein n=1 Tax=Dallia pectoralis TaxID=75939 RepID=A0ACC2F9N5_DALPE|nr:hypothetical protein DPEC_G00319860 [Dallia pectoralis]
MKWKKQFELAKPNASFPARRQVIALFSLVFTLWIEQKSFPPSQNPEATSPGVLGRIGSWFSPWRDRGSPSDDASRSPADAQGPKSEAQTTTEEPVRGEEGKQDEGHNSQPPKRNLSRDFKKADARQSAHRDILLSSTSRLTEPRGGGPCDEELLSASLVEEREQARRERSGACRNTSPESNSSLPTRVLSSSLETGSARKDSGREEHIQAPLRTPVQGGKTLHVYLEETSVSEIGIDARTKNRLLHTTTTRVKANIQTVSRAKSSKTVDLSSENTKRSEKRVIAPAPGVKGHSGYCVPVGGLHKPLTGTQDSGQTISRKSVKDTVTVADRDTLTDRNTDRDTVTVTDTVADRDTVPDTDTFTDTDRMGKKRRSRKGSSGEGGASSQENTPTKLQPALSPSDCNTPTPGDSTPSNTDQNASGTSQKADVLAGSPPAFGWGSNAAQQDQDAPVHATLVTVVDGGEDMDLLEDDITGQVERHTETAESKRRSIKVSHGEVKFFAKKVLVNPEQPLSPVEDAGNVAPGFIDGRMDRRKDSQGMDKGNLKPAQKLIHLKKVDEEHKNPLQPIGRIVEKISMFEGKVARGSSPGKTKSANVSPARKVTERLKTGEDREPQFQNQRGKSPERENARSRSAPHVQDQTVIQEGKINLPGSHKTEDKTKLTHISIGRTKNAKVSPGSAVLLITKPDIQEKLAGAVIPSQEALDTVKEAILPFPKADETDYKIKDKYAKKIVESTVRPSNTDVFTSAKGGSDPNVTQEIATVSQQPKVPGRVNSRSKRRKSKGEESANLSCEIRQDLRDPEQEMVHSKQDEAGTTKMSTLSEQEKSSGSAETSTVKIGPHVSIETSETTLLSHVSEKERPLVQYSSPVEQDSFVASRKVYQSKRPEGKTADMVETNSSTKYLPSDNEQDTLETVAIKENSTAAPELIMTPVTSKPLLKQTDPTSTPSLTPVKPAASVTTTQHFQSASTARNVATLINDAANGGHGDRCMTERPKEGLSAHVPEQKIKHQDPLLEKKQDRVSEPLKHVTSSETYTAAKTETYSNDKLTNAVSLKSELTLSKPITAVPLSEKDTVASKPRLVDPPQRPLEIRALVETKSQGEKLPLDQLTGLLSGPEGCGGLGLMAGKENSSVKSVAPEVNKSGDVTGVKTLPGQSESGDKEKTMSTRKVDEGKGKANKQQSPAASSMTDDGRPVIMISKTPLDGNGEVLPRTLPETTNDKSSPGRAQKIPSFAETTKHCPEFSQLPALNKLPLPGDRGGGLPPQRDSPSSWLDVDQRLTKRKVLHPPETSLSSSASDSDLDTSGELDDDFINNIKRLGTTFSFPSRKTQPSRQPKPPLALPAIHEDRLEKTFDPEEFNFGLSKKKFSFETSQSFLSKLMSDEVQGELRPARASLMDRTRGSMLLKSLDPQPQPLLESEKKEEEAPAKLVKPRPSRLEGSCIFSSLMNSTTRSKRSGDQPQLNAAPGGEGSPTKSPRLQPGLSPVTKPSQTLSSVSSEHIQASAKQPGPSPLAHPAPTSSGEAESQKPGYGPASQGSLVSESGPPIPSFNDIKLPETLEKYLTPREPAVRLEQSTRQETLISEVLEKKTLAGVGVRDVSITPRLQTSEERPPRLAPVPPSSLPEVKTPMSSLPQNHTARRDAATGFHRRPGKMVLFEHDQFGGQTHEVFRDMVDSTHLRLSPVFSAKVLRGCWLLYEQPGFQGSPMALEEGPIEQISFGLDEGSLGSRPQVDQPMVIGSIRLVVWDYSFPHVDLFTEPAGHGRLSVYHDDAVELSSFGIPSATASIKVHSGVWLVYSEPEFQGPLVVLEEGEYGSSEDWGFPTPFVGSLRPLKMGGFKVENPNEVKAVVYEQPGFVGPCLEIHGDVFRFGGEADGEGPDVGSVGLKSVGSVKILGGFWVGYDRPEFEGHQYILEEGEYLDWGDWGGRTDQLLSIRPVLADFMSPHLKMFSDRDFGERGGHIDLRDAISNMNDTNFGMKTQSIDVLSGVWVAFEEAGFSGPMYLLEKGLYGTPEDWGGLSSKINSVMPVTLDNLGNVDKFKVHLFSEPGFLGSVHVLEDSLHEFPQGFSVGSCKVLAGNWLAFEGLSFTGMGYVLEEGDYRDLRAMGCVRPNSHVLSLQTTGFEFSLPSITLFERSGLRGKRVVLTAGSVNLQLSEGYSRVQSVLVEGGMWILYEQINYRGAQILLKPCEVPDWRTLSQWQRIGSLRPLIQRQVHFRLRSQEAGLLMSVTGEVEDIKLMRIQAMEETGGVEQIWFYQDGHIHCKMLEECCVAPCTSLAMAGSRMSLSPEPAKQQPCWSITPEGFIRYTATPDLLLEVKGGQNYHNKQVILNTFDANKPNQRWTVEIL